MKVIVYQQQQTAIILTCSVCVRHHRVVLQHPVLPGQHSLMCRMFQDDTVWCAGCFRSTQFDVQALADCIRSNTHFSSEWFRKQHHAHIRRLQQCIVPWRWRTKIKWNTCWQNVGFPPRWCQRRQHEGRMWWAEPGRWCGCRLATHFTATTCVSGRRPSQQLQALHPPGGSVQSRAEREHQAALGQIGYMCSVFMWYTANDK